MDEVRLHPREQARIDDAMVRVSRGRGGGPFIVAALVAVAFLLGLVRPWDWLTTEPGASVAGDAGRADRAAGADSPGDPAPVPVPSRAPTCGYPTGWRTAAISFWAGARARIWTAAEAVTATGADDPSIPFHPIASDRVEAIGWCAPISGLERPPLVAEGTLFRLRDGLVTEVPVDRLEPAGPDALGELWVPPGQADGRQQEWAPGRYVIRLAVPSGIYARYLGLEVGVPTPDASGGPGPDASGGPGPDASGGPGPAASGGPGPAASDTAASASMRVVTGNRPLDGASWPERVDSTGQPPATGRCSVAS